MSDYALIAGHGLIGDLQTSALVTTDGSIDWFCALRLDSPSIFGALLDQQRGGRFRVRPSVEVFTSKQLYFPDTAVLGTRFMTEAGVGEVIDFMPVTGAIASTMHRLVRFASVVEPGRDVEREGHPARTHRALGQARSREVTLTVSGAWPCPMSRMLPFLREEKP